MIFPSELLGLAQAALRGKSWKKTKGLFSLALMSQAVLLGIKNGRRATKILMDDFFSIPLHLAKKKFFFRPHLGGAALLGGGGNPHFGGVNVIGSKRNFS